MQRKIEFVLYENDKEVEKILKETDTEPLELMKSLEDFRQTVNETLTKKIKDDEIIDVPTEDSDDEQEENQHQSPKKRKI